MLTLFAVSTLENWQDVQFATRDASDVDRGPIKDNCWICPYFFVTYIMIGTFFFLNFFIGVLFLNYVKAKEQETRGLTEKHLTWKDFLRMILQAQPDFESLHVPKQKWRKHFYKLVISNGFDYFIMSCIIANMLQMACLYEGASEQYIFILECFNRGFSVVFFVECVLKLVAFGKAYFIPAWHKFDFFVVLSSILDLFVELFITNPSSSISILRMGPQLVRVLRVLRVSKILRLLNKH